ncbi:hypothetical protein ZWY2020_017641 [Hordeum vulgare]|nr:hypothetical protein ZWY2020_017641 [Hordeum vulgare]
MAAVGSCCLLGAIAGDTLYVANLGDSRAVLGRRVVGGGVAVAERLSTDHNVASEEVRMEVSSQNPDDGQIVVHTRGAWRIKGIIQVSRSIGDVYLKKPEYSLDPLFRQIGPVIALKRPALSAEPQIHVRKLKPTDQFIIFASDGLWEHLSDDAAVQIVFKNPRTGIANRLVRSALKEATKKRGQRARPEGDRAGVTPFPTTSVSWWYPRPHRVARPRWWTRAATAPAPPSTSTPPPAPSSRRSHGRLTVTPVNRPEGPQKLRLYI